MINTKVNFLISLCCFIGLQASSQENFESIDSLIDTYQSRDDFNGTVLIAQNGEALYSRSLGYADFEKQIKLDNTTSMPMSSITKTFTVMAIMILEEKGLLSYDDKVNLYLNTIPYNNMTIRHLLTGTSGLKRLYNKAAIGDELVTIQEMIDFCSENAPGFSFKPGDKFLSSVVSYCLLAGIVEEVSKKSFDRFLEDEIFRPLGMGNTFLLTGKTRQFPRATSYGKNNKVKEWFLGSYSGGIGIYSSAEDLLKWDQALYGNSLVSQKSIKASYQPTQLNDGSIINHAFGWMRWKGQESLLFKNGDWVANSAILFRDIEHNTTIVILSNRQNRVSKFELMDKILPELGYSTY